MSSNQTPNYSEKSEPYPETKVVEHQGVGAEEDGEEEKEVIISCENIHKTYLLGIEGVAALRGASVDVYRGELLVIYGTSGGGKSTLLNVLGTIDVPTKGNLALLNSRITDQSEDAMMARLRCRNIGFVFQSFNLLGTMTAEENVSLPMVIAGEKTSSEIKERARQLLTDVGLGHRLDHIAGHLSGGEQQRVTIARAMANDPDIMLMDEPTGDLDSKNTELVLNILLTLNRTKKMTMVMVTHDVYMKQYADRVLYLRDGRVNRIETIDPSVRNGSYANLQQQVLARYQGQGQQQAVQMKKTVRKKSEYATAVAGKGINSSQKLNRNLLTKLFPAANDAAGNEVEMAERTAGTA